MPAPAQPFGAGWPLQPKPAHRPSVAAAGPCCDDCADYATAALAFRPSSIQPSTVQAMRRRGGKKKGPSPYELAQKNWKQYLCYSPNSASQFLKHHTEDAIVKAMVGCGLGTTGAYPGHCKGKKGSGVNNANPDKIKAIRECLDKMG